MKEELFNWDVYSKDPHKYQVFTREGNHVFKVYRNDEDEYSKYPLSALVEDVEGEANTWRYTFAGSWDVIGEDRLDITIMKSEISEPKTVEQWDEDFEHRYIPVFLINEPSQKHRVVSPAFAVYTDPLKALESGKKYEDAINEFLCVINLAEHPQVKTMLESKKLVKHIPTKP